MRATGLTEGLRKLQSALWLRYGLTALLVALVVWKARPDRLAGAITSSNPAYLMAALALTIPFLYLKALRWHLMLRQAGVEATLGEAVLSLIGGMGVALITPARLGEVVRAAYLRDAQKLKIGGLVMIDKGFDVLVLATLSIAGAWALLGAAAAAALTVAAACGLALVFNPSRVEAGLRAATVRLPGRQRIERVIGSLSCLSTPATSLFLALTLLSFVIVLLQFGIILSSWRSWSPDVVFLTFPLVILTNVVPLTPGGLGLREAAAAVLLGHYGVSPAHAALAAFLMFFINTALPGLGGALLTPLAAPATPAQSADRL